MKYEQKRDGLVCAKPNRHVSAYISGQDGPFGLLFFAFRIQTTLSFRKFHVHPIMGLALISACQGRGKIAKLVWYQ